MTQITQIGSKKNLRHLCNLRLKKYQELFLIEQRITE